MENALETGMGDIGICGFEVVALLMGLRRERTRHESNLGCFRLHFAKNKRSCLFEFCGGTRWTTRSFQDAVGSKIECECTFATHVLGIRGSGRKNAWVYGLGFSDQR